MWTSWRELAQSGNGSPGTTGRRRFNNTQFHLARFLQQPCQSWMHLGWGIKGCYKHLPLLWTQLKALPIGQCFGRAGQGAFEHEIGCAALCRRRRPLQGLLRPWCQLEVRLFAPQRR